MRVKTVAILSVLIVGCGAPGSMSSEEEVGAESQALPTGTWHIYTGYDAPRHLDSNTDGYVYLLARNSGKFQYWDIADAGTWGGYPMFEIKNNATGMALDSDYSGSVYTHSVNGGTYQRWIAVPANPADPEHGWQQLVNRQTGMCLDHNQGWVYTHSCNSGAAQLWKRGY